MTGPLSGAYAAFRGDPTAPMSPHSVHVAAPDDLSDVGVWTAGQLYAAVEAADRRGRVVVLDYGRDRLYLADEDDLVYRPPRLLGTRGSPALVVADPRVATVDTDDDPPVATRPGEPVTVSPEFDILVPAFDIVDEDAEPLPPVDARGRRTPSGAGTGTPG